jgi:threonine dehydrogenase-like Zn-dependent dehydrogenase
MEALVLERTGELSLRDIDIEETVGPHDVQIAIRNVGICGDRRPARRTDRYPQRRHLWQ